MPFTFSHPVIILPLRKFGSVTALVIGSMVPDFQGFIMFESDKKFSHSWTGVILLDLPMALLCCYIFHLVIRKPLIDHLPLYFKSRFIYIYSFNWNRYVAENKWKVFLSLIGGIISHLLWDQLTHPGSMITGIEKRVQIFGFTEPLFVFIQYACSLPAVLLIIIHIHRLPYSNVTSVHSKTVLYWMLVAVVFILILVGCLFNYYHYKYYNSILINACISGFLAGITISSIVSTIIKKRPIANTAIGTNQF